MRHLILLAIAIVIPVAVLAVDFEFYNVDPNVQIGAMSDPPPMVKPYIYLVNNEATPQEFHIHKDEILSSFMWTTPFCVNEFCYSPYVYDDTITVDAGVTDTVSVYFNQFWDEGYARVIISIWPIGLTAETIAETLTAISDGVDVLVVDGNGQDHESYYTGALPGGLFHGVWPRSVQAPTAGDLLTFPALVWGGDALANGDALALKSYLDGDRKLLLSGQDIAWSVCDPASPEYSTSACDLVTDYLGADYHVGASGTLDVEGDTPDPIGSGLSFSVGGGAGNQTDPDGISANAAGNIAFEYDGGAYAAGVHANDGDMRAVFLAFGLEGIGDAGTRSTIMQRAFDYFDETIDVAAGDGEVPLRTVLGPNRPNPFNPATRFTLSVPKAVHALVEIYDASGRVVKTLLDGTAKTGETVLVWDGTDNNGSPVRSGVYFAKALAGEKSETRKLTLIR